MKTTKKLIAVLLAIATLFTLFATSASALEKGDIVEWDHYGDYTEEILYDGTVKLGENHITFPDEAYDGEDYNVCYELTVEKDGYYKVASSDCYFSFAETYSQLTAANFKDCLLDCLYDDENWITGEIYYLTSGTHLMKAYSYYSSSTIKIEYYAEAITDIEYDEESVKNLVMECDEVYIDNYEKIIGIEIDYKVVFSNSKILENDNLNWLVFNYEGELADGENKVNLIVPGYEEEAVIGIYEAEDFIKEIKLENFENYSNASQLYIEYYYNTPSLEGLEATFIYTDGSKQTFVVGKDETITLPNGREFRVLFDSTVDERSEIGTGELTLYAYIGDGKIYYLEQYDVKKASFAENLELYKENIGYCYEYFTWNMDYKITRALENGEAYMIGQITLNCISCFLNDLYNETSALTKFYF